jgi:hypothetical protein
MRLQIRVASCATLKAPMGDFAHPLSEFVSNTSPAYLQELSCAIQAPWQSCLSPKCRPDRSMRNSRLQFQRYRLGTGNLRRTLCQALSLSKICRRRAVVEKSIERQTFVHQTHRQTPISTNKCVSDPRSIQVAAKGRDGPAACTEESRHVVHVQRMELVRSKA